MALVDRRKAESNMMLERRDTFKLATAATTLVVTEWFMIPSASAASTSVSGAASGEGKVTVYGGGSSGTQTVFGGNAQDRISAPSIGGGGNVTRNTGNSGQHPVHNR